MFFNNRFRKNSSRLIRICEDLIDSYETDKLKPSCKDDLMHSIKNEINAAKKEISDWKDYDTDYIKIAHTMLANTTFDLLASGRYHLYSGMLNPMSCASNMLHVYNASMAYGVKINMLTEEVRKEQYDYLMQCIFEVG